MQLRLIATLAIAMSWIAACGNPDKLDVTLRSRDGFGDPPIGCRFWDDHYHTETTTECVVAVLERHWVADDGREATSAAVFGAAYFSSELPDPVVCNGQTLPVNWWWFQWRVVRDDYVDVQFEDGSALMLHDERGMAMYDGIEVVCSKATGRWRGLAGSLLGRSGTYTSVYDSIQTVLHLVEE